MFSWVGDVKVFLIGLIGLIISSALIERFWLSWIIPSVARLLIHKDLLFPGFYRKKSSSLIENQNWKPNYFELRFIMDGSKLWNAEYLGLHFSSSATVSMSKEQVTLLNREDLTLPQWVLKIGRVSPVIDVRAAVLKRKEYIPMEEDVSLLAFDHPVYGPAIWSNHNWTPELSKVNALINWPDLTSDELRLAVWNNPNWVPSIDQLEVGDKDTSWEVREAVSRRANTYFKEKFIKQPEQVELNAL